MLTLDESERYCRVVVDRSGSSFRRSFEFLAVDARRAMDAIYAFARLTDDLSDHPSLEGRRLPGHAGVSGSPHLDPPRRIATQLHRWLDSLGNDPSHTPLLTTAMPDAVSRSEDQRLYELTIEFDRIAPSLGNTLATFAIDREHLHDLVRGTEYDLAGPAAVANDAELARYCYLVASSVGLVCVSIWRGDIAACEPAAISAGYAFQLTNILRDVAEDSRRGRIYLPLDQLSAFGCDIDSWLRSQPAGDWQGLMKHFAGIADEHYTRATGVLPHLPPDGQRMFSLMLTTYRGLLDQIVADLDRVWTTRIRLAKQRKLRIYLTHAFTPWFDRELRMNLRRAAAAS